MWKIWREILENFFCFVLLSLEFLQQFKLSYTESSLYNVGKIRVLISGRIPDIEIFQPDIQQVNLLLLTTKITLNKDIMWD